MLKRDSGFESGEGGARDDDQSFLRTTLERLIDACPKRVAGSVGERQAQEMLREHFARLGGECRWHTFRYGTNLYAALALHFGLAALASCLLPVSPLAALVLHLVVFISYLGDATRLFQPLRRLLPRRESQNLLARFPARRPMRRRLVVLGHADAAYTGWIFSIKPPKPFSWRPLRVLQRPMLIAMVALIISINVDIRVHWPETVFWWTYPCYYGWAVYFLVLALINLQVVWNRRVVPGANDNLVACVGQLVLAERLAGSLPDDVELVCVVTGAEEAGTGGALALVRHMRSHWGRGETVIVNLEGIGDGELRILEEGDVIHLPATRWLKRLAREVAAEQGRDELPAFTIPVGATDALPFLVRGYPAITVGCLDPRRGAPRHYHRMRDTPENIDYEQVVDSLNFTERLLRKLSRPSPPPGAPVPLAVSAGTRGPGDPPASPEE